MKQILRTSLVPVAAALALALIAAPLLAVDAPAGAPAAPMGPLAPYLACLRIVDLTEVQKADVKTIVEAARPTLVALHATLKTDREALRAEITAATPDPCKIGTALLKVEADRKAIGDELKAVRTAVEALLTPEQKAKLDGCLKAPKENAAAAEDEEY